MEWAGHVTGDGFSCQGNILANDRVVPAMVRAFEVAKRTDSLAEAFRKLQGRGLSMIPVVEMGRLVGIVTLQNLTHSMALLAESRRLKQAEQAND